MRRRKRRCTAVEVGTPSGIKLALHRRGDRHPMCHPAHPLAWLPRTALRIPLPPSRTPPPLACRRRGEASRVTRPSRKVKDRLPRCPYSSLMTLLLHLGLAGLLNGAMGTLEKIICVLPKEIPWSLSNTLLY